MAKSWGTLLAVAWALIALIPAHAHAIGLKEAVHKALTEHPQLGAAQERVNASAARLGQSNAALMPTLDLDADAGKQYVDRPNSLTPENNARWWPRRQATLSAGLVLFDGWQRANAIYRDQARIDAANFDLTQNAENVALQVIEAYIDHRRHYFLLRVADENIAGHQRILGLSRARFNGGKATQSEVDQVQERLYAARAVRAEILQAALEADAKFLAAVGLDPSDTTRVVFPDGLPRSKAQAIEQALATSAAIQARDAEASAFDFETERARGEYLPTLKLEGNAQVGHDLNAVPGRNDDYSVKLRLNWRLYDGGYRNSKVAEAAANASEARLKRDLQARKIVEAAQSTWGKLVASGARLEAVSAQVNAARKVASSYYREYEASKRSLLDLLDAENAVFSSRFEEASISGVRLFSAYYLKALNGTLLSWLGVNAPTADNAIAPSAIGKRSTFGLKIEPLR